MTRLSEAMYDTAHDLEFMRQFEFDKRNLSSIVNEISSLDTETARKRLSEADETVSRYDGLFPYDVMLNPLYEKINEVRTKLNQKKDNIIDAEFTEIRQENIKPEIKTIQGHRIDPDYSPSLNDLLEFYESNGLVGERGVAVAQTLGAINKLSFGIESMSGSGKSYAVEMLMKILPEDAVYKMELSSKTATMYDERIDSSKIIYIPELQKAMQSNPMVVEILKSLTEGKDITRTVYDNTKKDVNDFTIKGNKGVIFTLATENAFKYDLEFSRRVFVLHTDISKEQTEKILETYVKRPSHKNFNGAPLKQHISECLDTEIDAINPFARYIITKLPKTIMVRGYADHLFSLIDACTKFNFKQRTKDENNHYADLADVFAVDKIYGSAFMKSLYKLPLLGLSALDVFDNGTALSLYDIHDRLNEKMPGMSLKLTTKTIDDLVDRGFVELDSGKGNAYRRRLKANSVDLGIDYAECWNDGVNFMKENSPKSFDAWFSRQMVDGGIVLYDPITKSDTILNDGKIIAVKDEAEVSSSRNVMAGLRIKVMERDGFKCRFCGKSPANNPGTCLHMDHIIPYSKGGPTTYENLQTLCRECNLGKQDKEIRVPNDG